MIKTKVGNGTVEFKAKGNIVELTSDILNIIAALYKELSERQRLILEKALKCDEIWGELKSNVAERERKGENND